MFLCFFGRFWPPFWLHFGTQNRPRGPSGPKRATFDFEQPSHENQAFWPWRVPGACQNRSRKRLQILMRFSLICYSKPTPKGTHKRPKMESKSHQNLNQNPIKQVSKIAQKWRPKVTQNGAKTAPKTDLSTPERSPGVPEHSPGAPERSPRAPEATQGRPRAQKSPKIRKKT